MMTRHVVHLPRAVLACRRESSRFPGLVLELNAPFLTFRHGRTCEVYQLLGGTAELIASSRESYRNLDRFEHARVVAAAYAQILARRRA